MPGVTRHRPADGLHERTFRAPHGPCLIAAHAGDDRGIPEPVVCRADPRDAPAAAQAAARWCGGDVDIEAARAAFADDEVLGPLVRRHPDTVVSGAVDAFEAATLTLIGQQVSLAAARTFAGRLVEGYGSDGVDGLRLFPTAHDLADVDVTVLRARVGLTRARAAWVCGLARAACDHPVPGPGDDPDAARQRWRAVAGVGPWTSEYLTLRVCRDLDAFPAEDLVLRRVLGVSSARAAREMAERWRPWRGVAASLLWTAAAYA